MRKVIEGQGQFHPQKVVGSIDRMIVKLEKLRFHISLLEENRNSKLPKCGSCSVRNVRMRQDQSYFCYSCGYDSKKGVVEK